jgi:hypothetical protein
MNCRTTHGRLGGAHSSKAGCAYRVLVDSGHSEKCRSQEIVHARRQSRSNNIYFLHEQGEVCHWRICGKLHRASFRTYQTQQLLPRFTAGGPWTANLSRVICVFQPALQLRVNLRCAGNAYSMSEHCIKAPGSL